MKLQIIKRSKEASLKITPTKARNPSHHNIHSQTQTKRMTTQDSISNREKIYSAGGEALFGKVYSCAEAPSGGSFQVLISMYKATKNIMKSPNAMNNRNKICRKGIMLCVIKVATEGGDDSRECCILRGYFSV